MRSNSPVTCVTFEPNGKQLLGDTSNENTTTKGLSNAISVIILRKINPISKPTLEENTATKYLSHAMFRDVNSGRNGAIAFDSIDNVFILMLLLMLAMNVTIDRKHFLICTHMLILFTKGGIFRVVSADTEQ